MMCLFSVLYKEPVISSSCLGEFHMNFLFLDVILIGITVTVLTTVNKGRETEDSEEESTLNQRCVNPEAFRDWHHVLN